MNRFLDDVSIIGSLSTTGQFVSGGQELMSVLNPRIAKGESAYTTYNALSASYVNKSTAIAYAVAL